MTLRTRSVALLAFAALCGSAAAADLPKRPADGRLAYLQYADKGCVAGVWDSKSRASRILGSLPECPDAVSVTSHEQMLVLIFPNSLRLVDLGTGKIGDPIPMPAGAVGKNREDEASLAGYTADGDLALNLHGVNPDSSYVNQLFRFKAGAWQKLVEKQCGEYDDCPLQPAIQARQLDDFYGVGPDGLVNESQTADQYVTGRNSKDATRESGADDGAPPDEDIRPAQVTLSFRVDGKDSQLQFYTQPDEDSGNYVYTMDLKLVLPDKHVLTISDDQYGSTLVGHYLFYHGFFGNGVRLYDVGSGEVVLDKLETGGWLH